jgi:hypothetical protein
MLVVWLIFTNKTVCEFLSKIFNFVLQIIVFNNYLFSGLAMLFSSIAHIIYRIDIYCLSIIVRPFQKLAAIRYCLTASNTAILLHHFWVIFTQPTSHWHPRRDL